MFDQLGALLKVAADFDDLLDIVVGGKLHGPYVDQESWNFQYLSTVYP